MLSWRSLVKHQVSKKRSQEYPSRAHLVDFSTLYFVCMTSSVRRSFYRTRASVVRTMVLRPIGKRLWRADLAWSKNLGMYEPLSHSVTLPLNRCSGRLVLCDSELVQVKKVSISLELELSPRSTLRRVYDKAMAFLFSSLMSARCN